MNLTSTSAPASLHGLVAVVTGGAKGIGLGIARELAQAGCRIALWAVSYTHLTLPTKA